MLSKRPVGVLAIAGDLPRSLQHPANVAIWNDVGARSTNSCDAAQWALDLHHAGRIWLSPREIDFLASCTAWQGGLTAKMAEWLRGILDRAVAATGCVPPS
jgi:hypothetical protein